MRGVLRGAIPSCILHAALHCCLSMLMLQMMMPHRCYYVLMACIDVTMHLMACSTASTTPHCLACCMCMHRLPMCISGRERWGWALELRSEVTLKFCTYESCLISKYTVVWGPRWYHSIFFIDLILQAGKADGIWDRPTTDSQQIHDRSTTDSREMHHN